MRLPARAAATTARSTPPAAASSRTGRCSRSCTIARANRRESRSSPSSQKIFASSSALARVHQVRRRQRLPRVHPHVQRPVLLETESALRPRPVAANSRPNPAAPRRNCPAAPSPPTPQNSPAGSQIARRTPPAAPAPPQPRRHRDRSQTTIQSANSRPRWLPRVQPHRASRRRTARPAFGLSAASTSATITGL